jgi:ribonuclease G
VVYLPTVDHVGVSRRIEGGEDRQRLKDIAAVIKAGLGPDSGGLIVRTAAEASSLDEFREDLDFLRRLWADVKAVSDRTAAPALVHEDLDLVMRCVRDLLTDRYDKVVVDTERDHARVLKLVERFMPDFKGAIEHYQGGEPLLDVYAVDTQLSRALDRKVWLKSGGTIVIDQTEALTTIDVNTGRFVGRTNLEDTIVQINLEAVREIVYQIRLRNIGGIIVIDFIDMQDRANAEKLYQALQAALRSDRVRSNVLRMSELGLVEMTRKRVRESLAQSMCEPCTYCGGSGKVRSKRVLCMEILERIRRAARGGGDGPIEVTAHPRVIEILVDEYGDEIERLERDAGRAMVVRAAHQVHVENFAVVGLSRKGSEAGHKEER